MQHIDPELLDEQINPHETLAMFRGGATPEPSLRSTTHLGDQDVRRESRGEEDYYGHQQQQQQHQHQHPQHQQGHDQPNQNPYQGGMMGEMVPPGQEGDRYHEQLEGKPGQGSGRKPKGNDAAMKRTRQSQSCDPCRARKVKCDRPPPGTPMTATSRLVCSHCTQLGLACTFEYKPKKRGPPNMYIKKLQAERDASNQEEAASSLLVGPLQPFPQDPSRSPNYPRRDSIQHHPGTYSHSTLNTYSAPPVEGYYPPNGPGGTLSSQNAYGNSALGHPGQGRPSFVGRPIAAVWDETLQRAVASNSGHRESLHSDNGVEGEGQRYGSTLSPVIRPNTAPGSGYDARYSHPGAPPGPSPRLAISPSFSSPQFAMNPAEPANPLDRVLPRGLLMHIIDLYFDYIYALIPAIHRPTFNRDLAERREEREGQEEWTHMVLILVCSTLLQVPRAFVPLPRREVKAIVEKCWDMTRRFMVKDWSEVSLERLTIHYLSFLSAHLLGHSMVGHSLAGQNIGTLVRLRLHEEASYASLPPIEREFRRRLFYLAFSGDRSYCAIDGLSTLFTEEDCDVQFPSQLDDECITQDAYLEQPEYNVPYIAGFIYNCKIFRLLGQVLSRRRVDKRTPPAGIMLQMRLQEVSDLYDRIMSVMDDCPEPLRLEYNTDRSLANFTDDWDAHASADIRTLFFDPKASRAVAKDAYLVQQANIYVTQQMVRYITLQYRDDLLSLRKMELAKSNDPRDSPPSSKKHGSARLDWSQAMFSEQQKDQVAMDLLSILQKIPIQVIAVNSASLVTKVRYIASTLLDSLTVPTPLEPGSSPDDARAEQVRAEKRTQKAQTYLWDFLRILSEIEALYSFEDDHAPPGGLINAGSVTGSV